MIKKAVIFKNISQLICGAGVLFVALAFLPILADYRDFFLFIGISSLLGGIFSIFFRPRLVYRDVSETVKSRVELQSFSEKQNSTKILFLIIIAGFLINQLLLARYNAQATSNTAVQSATNTAKNSLSPTDKILVTELQQQGKEIPVLGTAHNHADLNIYVNNERLVLATPANFMKSSFLHLDNNQNPDDANSVLHMHAKNVPLWLFFRSIGMKLDKNSLTTPDGRILKNGGGNTLKFYLNGRKVEGLGDYVFQPLDKLLISYGSQNDPVLQNQINSVKNYAKDHQK